MIWLLNYLSHDLTPMDSMLPVTFARTYNSMATGKSVFGYGWTHSYDVGLLRLGKDNNLDEGILVYRDGSGTLYQFKLEGDKYISSLGKYVNLTKEYLTTTVALPDNTGEGDNQVLNMIVSSAYTMTTRDGITYRFDSGGKLIYVEETNGNLLLFGYDSKRGLLSKITTGNNISIEFEYYDSAGGNDALTIRQITLPDGQKILYEYDNSLLTKVTKLTAGQVSGGIEYSYSYNPDRKMTSLTDGEANTYSITYDDAAAGEAGTFTYPAAGGVSESVRITRDSSTNSTVTEKLMGNAVVKTEKDYFDGSGRCIRHEDYSADNVYAVDYEYMDGLISKETSYVTYSLLNKGADGSTGSITTASSTKVKTYEYDADENLVKEVDENTSEANMTYNMTGEWNSYLPTEYSEEVDGVTVADEVYTYDSFGNMIKLQDNVSNRVTEYEYYTGASDKAKGAVKSEKEYELVDGVYSASTLISSTDTVFTYGSDGTKTETITSVSGGNKTVTVSVYDVMGRVLSETVYTYTKYGTVDETISRETNTYTYDGYGRVTSVTTTRAKVNGSLADIEGTIFTSTETKSYDDNGTLISETGADGITTTYQYDALNRVTGMTKTDGVLSQTTNTTYSCGNVSVNEGKTDKTTYTNALITTQTVNGMVENITYQDGMGRTVRSEVYGVVTDYSYDAQGNRVTEMVLTDADGNGRLIYHVLDEEGRETATVHNPVWDETLGVYTIGADAICEAVIYDKSGNMIQSTDGEGNVIKFTYDEQGRLTKVVLVNGTDESNVTTFAYVDDIDSGSFTSTITMTNAEGGISTETTDESGNIIKVSDKGKLDENITPIETTYTYDARGNLLKEIHKAGDYITYDYDSKDRMTVKVQYNQSGSAVYRTEYTYYDNDLVREMLDYSVSGGAKTLYRYTYKEYDGLKRLTKLAEINTDTVPASVEGYAVNYTYDLNDNVTEITYDSSLGTEVSGVKYVYENNRLKEVKVKIGSTYYLAKGYTYNLDGSVETVKDYYNFRSGGAEYMLLTYTYDSFGRVASMVYTLENDIVESHSYAYDKNNNIVREVNVNTYAGVNEVREYTYDYMGQLKKSVLDNENNVLTTVYTYDKVGNRISKTENGSVTSYTYNGLNQLKSESGVNSLTYTYDDNGNQTGIAGTAEGETVNRAFTYTPAGMLASYTDGTSTQTNLYNGEGQRIRKTEGSDVTNYFYQEGSVLYTTGSDSALKSFNLLNVSDIFASSRINGTSESYYFYTEDMRGSTVNIIDSTAGQVASYWYSDFGEVTEAKAASYSNFVNEIQYTGAVYDELTGLLYLNARFYDPETGRFITQDTYRGERNNPDTWHLYAYCANNPINYVDPSGHIAERIVGAIVGAGINAGIEIISQGLVHLFKNNMNISKMKSLKIKWSKVGTEAAWGSISGIMLTTRFGKNLQAFVSGATNSLKGIVEDLLYKKKFSAKTIVINFAVGFIAGYVGGDGLGKTFYERGIFYKKGYYKFGNVTYKKLPILKKTVLTQFAKSLSKYIASSIISRIKI